MNKLLPTLSILFSLVAIPAVASASPSNPKDDRAAPAQAPLASRLIERLDDNDNGTLEAREVKGTPLADRFAVLDVDDNGRVTKRELTNGARAMSPEHRPPGPRGARGPEGGNPDRMHARGEGMHEGQGHVKGGGKDRPSPDQGPAPGHGPGRGEGRGKGR